MEQTANHFPLETLKGYVAGALLADDLIALDEHLSACDDCLRLVRGLMNLGGDSCADARVVLGSEPPAPPAHLVYRQVESYADGLLTGVELEIFEAHVSGCAECAGTARSLREFKKSMSDAETH